MIGQAVTVPDPFHYLLGAENHRTLYLFYLFYILKGTARSKKEESSADYLLRSSYYHVTSLLSCLRREPSESDHNRKYVGLYFFKAGK